MSILKKFNAVMIHALEYLLAFLLLASVVLIVAQVFTRYVLHAPLGWTEQSARFLFIWMMTLGVAVTLYRNSAMAFDLLLHKFHDPFRYFLELFIMLAITFFSSYYGYCAYQLVMKSQGRFTSGVRVPLPFMYSSMIISNILVVLVMIEKILEHLQDRPSRLKGGAK